MMRHLAKVQYQTGRTVETQDGFFYRLETKLAIVHWIGYINAIKIFL